MSFLSSLSISGSGLTASQLRMDIISENIANAQTTRTEDGGPYRRKLVVLQSRSAGFQDALNTRLSSSGSVADSMGVVVADIIEDETDFTPVYNPEHPDADEDGYVMMPNVDTSEEAIDMLAASRAYDANLTAFNAMKAMAVKALEIGR